MEFSARTSDFGTPQVRAAASRSISRAAAPAFRSGSQSSSTLEEPLVHMSG
ncbi:MAG: hypothetical protein M3167_10170 [Acidobacteriota bacterium]|nr:hypothetical protein [Acidobacteriota bacterium]